jgi:hypothetical protein
MWNDPVVEEIHRAREEHARKFNFNLEAIVEDLHRIERGMKATPVSLPPKPVDPHRKAA